MARLVPFRKLATVPGLEGVSGFDSEHPWIDHLPGGDADKMDPNQFDIAQLTEGVKEEMEHTDDPNIAAEIAMDHLSQDPEYYKKLKQVEGDGEKISMARLAGQLMAKEAKSFMGSLGAGLGAVKKVFSPRGLPSASALGAAKLPGAGAGLRPSALPMNLSTPAPAFSSGTSGLRRVPPTGKAPASKPSSPGTVAPRQPAPSGSTAVTKVNPAPAAVTKAGPAPAAVGKVTPAPGASTAKPTGRAAAKGGPKKIGLGRMALLGGAGLGAYGLYKAVPPVAKAAMEESKMPMAYGGGWSATPYGYGYTPWGSGVPNMGPG